MTPRVKTPKCRCGATCGLHWWRAAWWCPECLEAKIAILESQVGLIQSFLVTFRRHSARAFVSGDSWRRLRELYRVFDPEFAEYTPASRDEKETP